jgi:hypothetical protein
MKTGTECRPVFKVFNFYSTFVNVCFIPVVK